MPALSAEQFRKMNLMAGTARSLEQEIISPDDAEVWERDWALLVDDLSRLVDPELGADLQREKGFYDAANQVAKGYFDKLPFGGLKCATGQYGFRLLGPQDLKTNAAGATPAFYSWVQTVVTTSVKTYKTAAIGTGGAEVYVRNASNKRAVVAFHRLISYKPSPKLILVEFKINDVPYTPYVVEPFSKISKNDKLFKIIPMPGRVVLHPGGKIYITFYFDLSTGATAPVGTTNVDIEIAPFGLVFGEHDYLDASELT